MLFNHPKYKYDANNLLKLFGDILIHYNDGTYTEYPIKECLAIISSLLHIDDDGYTTNKHLLNLILPHKDSRTRKE